MIEFKSTVIKIGNSYGLTIPKDFVQNDYVEPGKQYKVSLILMNDAE